MRRLHARELGYPSKRADSPPQPRAEGIIVTRVGAGVVVLSGSPAVLIPGLPRTEMMLLCAVGWAGFAAAHLDEVRLVRHRLIRDGADIGGYTTLRVPRRIATISVPGSDGTTINVALNVVHEAAHHLHPFHRDPLASEVAAQEAAVLAWQDAVAVGIMPPEEEAWTFGWQVAAVRVRGGFLYAPFIRAQQRALQGRMPQPLPVSSEWRCPRCGCAEPLSSAASGARCARCGARQ